MGLFSFSVVKFWQGIVEIILRATSIVLMAITFISCIALVDALSAERTRVRLIEDLRFDTRSPSGWTLLLCLIAIPLSIILLVVRFLDLKFIINNRKIFLIVDVIVAILLAVGYFCGGVPLAVHADDWKFWRERATDNDTRRYNLDAIVSSAQATATFAFFTMLSLIVLAVWLILFLLLSWGPPRHYQKADFTPKVQMVGGEVDEVRIEKEAV